MNPAPIALGLLGLAAGSVLGALFVRRRLRDVERAAAWTREDLQRREQASVEERRVQDLILDTMEDGVLLFDDGWRTVFANRALERHLGSRPAAIAQLHPPALRRLARSVADSGEVATTDVELGAPTRWLHVVAAPAGPGGSVLLVLADVTETKRLEEVRRDLIANASHELKTPIASIQAAAETLVEASDDPAATARFAPQLQREAIRLGRIVTDLLDLSRLESGGDALERVRLNEIAAEEVERASAASAEAGISLTADLQAAALAGSHRDLSLLVRNLLDNAIRYTGEGGDVRITSATDGHDVVLKVRDTGIGIPSRDLERVFERFYRVDPARSRETGGTGLGLSLAKHVAENHGGSVSIRSELGRGTEVEVRLPGAAGG